MTFRKLASWLACFLLGDPERFINGRTRMLRKLLLDRGGA